MDLWLFTLLCLIGVAACVVVGWAVVEFFEPLFDEYEATKHGFINDLEVRLVSGRSRGRWSLLAPLHYVSAAGAQYEIHKGFPTDFATVPRWPLAFLAAGSTAHCASALHDWLLHQGTNRKDADYLFYEAALSSGVKKWRAVLMYFAMRVSVNARELFNKLRA